MLYAILCYHDEDAVGSWTKEQDAAVMQKLSVVQDKLTKQGRLGPVARLLPTTADMPIDAAVAASLADWQGQLSERLGVVIGETAVDLDGERGNVRTKETNLGNLVADIMRETTGADVAQRIAHPRVRPIAEQRDGERDREHRRIATAAGAEQSGSQPAQTVLRRHGRGRRIAGWRGFSQRHRRIIAQSLLAPRRAAQPRKSYIIPSILGSHSDMIGM